MDAAARAALRADLREAVDDTWAETLRHLPMAGGQSDPERAPAEFQAVLRTGARDGDNMRAERSGRRGLDLMGDGGTLRIDRGKFPGLVMRQSDKLVALDRSGQPVFEVLAVDDRHHHRLLCELGDVT